jgi:hypothetical protein
MKNSNDTVGNQTRDLPTCSAVSQPTALPRAPILYISNQYSVFRTVQLFFDIFSYLLAIRLLKQDSVTQVALVHSIYTFSVLQVYSFTNNLFYFTVLW